MKKVLLILMMFLFTIPLFAQKVVTNGNTATATVVPTLSLAATDSTTYVFKIPPQSFASAQFRWLGADQTDGTIVAYSSNYDSNFVRATTIDTVKMAAANGVDIVTSTAALVPQYLRFTVYHGTNTTGSVRLYLNLYK